MSPVIPRQPGEFETVAGVHRDGARTAQQGSNLDGRSVEHQPRADPTGPAPAAARPVASASRSSSAPQRGPRGAGRPVAAAVYRLLDGSVVVGVLIAALILRNMGRMPNGLEGFLSIRLSVKNVLLLLGFVAAWRGICALCGLYDLRRTESWRSESRRVLLACSLGGVVALAFPLTSASGAFDYLALGLFWAGASLGLLGLRWVLRFVSRVRIRTVRHVVIVGSGPRALHMKECLQADPYIDYHVLGFVDSDAPQEGVEGRQRLVGTLEDFDATLMHTPIDEVVVALPVKSCYNKIQHVVEFCESIGVPVTLPADPVPSLRSAFRPRPSESMLAITLADAPEGARLIVKRAIDLVGASLALVVLSPLMLVTALMIKVTSRGPVLYAQERYGYNRRIFRMYKFRTMGVDAESLQATLEPLNEAAGPLFKIRHDPRLTPIGGFLRRTSIDELPQLFNVLRGEMSLVGPRPMAIRDVLRFPEAALMRRFSARAGMTGLWQIQGRSTLDYESWAACDVRYIDQWSLSLDLKILALTLPAVFRGTGAE
jgi:exopolysaccharide biosynthesis polyprenyl glycosylphosphotransferase